MLSPAAENANNTAAKHARTHGTQPAFKSGMNSATQLDQPLPFGFSVDTVEPIQSPKGIPPIKQLYMPNDDECLPCPDDSENCNGQFANRTSPSSSIATATTADTTSAGSNETSFATTQTLPFGFTTGEASQALLEEMRSTFFDQPRVCRLFGGKCDSLGLTRSNLVRWIKKLEEAMFQLTGFQYIVNKSDSTPLSHDQSQRILLKTRYLLLSYKQALAHMPRGMSWYDCIEAATKGVVCMFGEKAWRCNRTIGRWNIAFWQTEKFPHPSILVELGKQSMPAIFDQMPEAKKSFESWANETLTMVLVETAQCYIHDILLPESYQWMRHEATAVGTVPITYDEFLDQMQLRTVSLSTACQCLSSAGLKFKT